MTQAAVERADRWLGQIDARGGTDILGALDAALQLVADQERQRYVVFLTDGAVSAEDEALRRVERQLGRSRLFTFGIGPSVNRALLARLAELGHGTAEFLQLDEDIEAAIVRFQDRVAYPVIQDLQLSWQGGTAWDIYPARLPDLYIGQPLELVARFQPSGSTPARLTISGRREREAVQLHVDLPPAVAAEPIVVRAWARARVTALLDAIRDDSSKTSALRGEIIGLAIEQRLLTPYTAFVAVDSEVASEQSGAPKRVQVAVPLPEGLDIEGFGGETLARGITGFAMRSPAPMAPPSVGGAMPQPAAPGQAKRSTGKRLRDLFGSRSEQGATYDSMSRQRYGGGACRSCGDATGSRTDGGGVLRCRGRPALAGAPARTSPVHGARGPTRPR